MTDGATILLLGLSFGFVLGFGIAVFWLTKDDDKSKKDKP